MSSSVVILDAKCQAETFKILLAQNVLTWSG